MELKKLSSIEVEEIILKGKEMSLFEFASIH